MSTISLSSNLENYLEVIADLSKDHGHAHVKDVAQVLNVKAPSVTNALQALLKRGLVNYKAYSPITLTVAGSKRAQELDKTQKILKQFFKTYLNMGSIKAETFACRLEHNIDKEIISRIELMNRFRTENMNNANQFLDELKTFMDINEISDTLSLIELIPGDEGIIKEIKGEKILKRRIAEMGLSKGQKIKVVRTAPLGDPIEVRVRDYSLSLRKQEAEVIEVEKK